MSSGISLARKVLWQNVQPPSFSLRWISSNGRRKFSLSSGEIVMKEVFLIFLFLDERASHMMVSYFVKKKW